MMRLLTILALLAALPTLASAQRHRRPREEPPPPEPPAEQAQEAPPPTEPAPPPEAAPAQEPEAEALPDEPLSPDVAPIRAELAGLMDELVTTRSRIATLGRQLFRTRIVVRIQNRADAQILQNLALTLDGAQVHRTEGRALGEDATRVFEGALAPGPHVIGLEIEQRAREGEEYRYTLRETYRIQAVREKLTEVTIVLDDDSGIAEDFPSDEEGEYDVRTRVRVATRALGGR